MPGDVVHTCTLGSLTLAQVQSVAVSPGAQVRPYRVSGGIDPSVHHVGPIDPRATISSMDVASAMAISNILTAGIYVASGTVLVPFQKRAAGGTYAGSTAHETLSATDALIVPRGIECQQDGDAMVSLECFFRSTDGVTNPVTQNENATLSAETFDSVYSLGPASINGSTVGEVLSLSVDPGITVKQDRSNGGQYPDALYIQERNPTITITFRDYADQAANYSFGATVGTAMVAYLRKRSGTGYVANGTAQHIKFSFTDGMTHMDDFSASGNEDGIVTHRYYGESLAVSAASAIT